VEGAEALRCTQKAAIMFFGEKVYEGIYVMAFNKDGQDIQDLYH